MSFLILIILVILTIRYLPFINTEAALRFQFWVQKIEKNLQELADKMDKERERRKNEKRK